MTSKISFSKLIKEDIKKRAWLLLVHHDFYYYHSRVDCN